MQFFARKYVIIFFVVIFFLNLSLANADLITELKNKIAERNSVISNLEKEIAEYKVQVEKTGSQAKSLKNDIDALELTRKKLSAEIKVLENKISATSLVIEELNIQISTTKKAIDRAIYSIGATIRQTSMEESDSLLEVLLKYPSISFFLDKVESLREINRNLKLSTDNLHNLKLDIEKNRTEVTNQRKELVGLAGELTDKKKIAEYNKVQTNNLLAETKNKQTNYQKILNLRLAQKKAFEQELLQYESELKFAIDPASLPSTGSGVLQWPVDKVKITQQFGDTDFSRTNPQAYSGKGHNGVDLAASVGTKIKSALSGKVLGIGDTDKACSGASYGKWVLIEHGNGLTTLYAHLSVIKVIANQTVSTGDVIGYSGETGYATGPHLHFTVYASQGVKIISRASTVCKTIYTVPVGSLNAYLNPLLYL